LFRVRFVPLNAPLLDESLTVKILDVALHPRAVTSITQPREVVGWNYTKLAYLAERLDLGLPQGIFAVADTIDCSPAVMSIFGCLNP